MEYVLRKLAPSDFPPSLLEIPEPPKQLYVVGELPPPDEYIYLTVVGSRKYSTYGKDVCEKLIAGLAGYKVVIVSGLALGMDAIAHEAALKVGLPTIGMPGSGLDPSVVAPRTNFLLSGRILQAGGALISEYEPKFRATIWSFPRRNRVMVGLSRAVLIIEATEKSGTLITARLGTEYNRDVLAVPGSIFSESSKGTNALIRQGATPITSVGDLRDALGLAIEATGHVEPSLFTTDPDELEILELLMVPASREEILEVTNQSITELNTMLSILEIKGLIKEELGKIRRI
jgi:DNA processing protein